MFVLSCEFQDSKVVVYLDREIKLVEELKRAKVFEYRLKASEMIMRLMSV